MIGAWLMVACVAAALFQLAHGWQAWAWHHRGEGARLARAEYARLHREHVDNAEARLSEAEFVSYFVSARPGITRFVLAAVSLLLLGLPAAWALMAGWPWR